MAGLAAWIDGLNERIGRGVAWLTLAMVILQFALVLLRYVFGIGDRAWEELLLYFHGSLFLLAAAYTLKHDGHVRVDLLYRDASPSMRARVNLFGTLFLLLPVCVLIGWAAWPFVMDSWAVREGSIETSGLPFTYLYKSVLLVFVALMVLQGIAQIAKSVLILQGRATESHEDAPAL